MKRWCNLVLPLCAALAACTDSTAPRDRYAGSPDLGTLPVGVSRTLTFAQAAGGLTIPAALSDAQYAIVVSNLNTQDDPQYDVTVASDWLATGTTFVPPRQTLLAGGAPSEPVNERFETALRARERAQLRLTPGTLPVRRAILPGPAVNSVQVGDKLTIRVGGTVGNGCEGQPVTTGIVRGVSQHAIFVIDSAAPGNGTTPGTTFSSADLDAIGQDFDNVIFPTDTSYFGSPSDIDGNGKIIIYYTPEVNKLTPSSSTTGRVGGFFFAGDLFPTTGGNKCAESNESEIFYLLAPDPNGRFSIPITVEQVRQLTRGTIAHEFQHMINAGNRLFRSDATNFEAAWLDEALAHFAESAVGRVEAGLSDLHPVSLEDLQQMDTLVQSAFFIQNLARAKIYLSDPSSAAPVSSEDKVGRDLAARGAAWSFLCYASDWFSHDAPRALMRKLAFGPDTGTTNITRQTGQPLDTLLSRWLLALYADHNSSSDVPEQFGFRSYVWRPVLTAVNDGSGNGQHYTLPVHVLGSGAQSYSASYPGTSGAFFVTSSQGTSESRRVTITSSASSSGRVYILRLR